MNINREVFVKTKKELTSRVNSNKFKTTMLKRSEHFHPELPISMAFTDLCLHWWAVYMYPFNQSSRPKNSYIYIYASQFSGTDEN